MFRWLVILFLAIPWTVFAQGEPMPSHPVDSGFSKTARRLARIEAQLETLRIGMGRSRTTLAPLTVVDATVRDIFFCVRTLEAKSDWLSFEQLHKTPVARQIPKGKIKWTQVHAELDQTIEVLDSSVKFLKLNEWKTPVRKTPETQDDLYLSILQASRQLNLLLERETQPQDVYIRVTYALGYSSRIRTLFAKAKMPKTPKFEPEKKPRDVYALLLKCHKIVRRMGASSDIKMISLMINKHQLRQVRPSDVLDVANLIVSEIQLLHAQTKVAHPLPPYDPGKKTPSDVFQRATLLQRHLKGLAESIESNPEWMGVR